MSENEGDRNTNQNNDGVKTLTAADLLRGGGLRPIFIPQLGGQVYIKPLTAGAVLDYVAHDGKERLKAQINLVADALCDERGNLLFSREEALKLNQTRMDVFRLIAQEVTKDFVQEEPASKTASSETGGDVSLM